MPSDIASILLRFPWLAADVIANLRRCRLTEHLPLAHDHADRSQIFPQRFISNTARLVDGEVLSPFDATVLPFDRLMVAVAVGLVPFLQVASKTRLDIGKQPFLVVLDGQDI